MENKKSLDELLNEATAISPEREKKSKRTQLKLQMNCLKK